MLSARTLATGSLELKAEKQSAHSDRITSVGFNNDGTKIVSGSRDQTIKVWDAGTPAAQLLTKPKAECPQRLLQDPWSSRRRSRARTAAG